MVPDSEHSANCVRDGINESDTVLGIVLSDYAGVNSQKKNGAENGLRETSGHFELMVATKFHRGIAYYQLGL